MARSQQQLSLIPEGVFSRVLAPGILSILLFLLSTPLSPNDVFTGLSDLSSATRVIFLVFLLGYVVGQAINITSVAVEKFIDWVLSTLNVFDRVRSTLNDRALFIFNIHLLKVIMSVFKDPNQIFRQRAAEHISGERFYKEIEMLREFVTISEWQTQDDEGIRPEGIYPTLFDYLLSKNEMVSNELMLSYENRFIFCRNIGYTLLLFAILLVFFPTSVYDRPPLLGELSLRYDLVSEPQSWLFPVFFLLFSIIFLFASSTYKLRYVTLVVLGFVNNE